VSDGQEIERKFLITEPLPFELDEYSSEPISQGYVAIADDGSEVRVRKRGDGRYLTIKSGPSGTRVEEEFEIEPRRFEALWPLTEGRRVEKRRYKIPADDELTIELDVYAGDLDGLMTAEVEFESEEQADGFDPPPWMGTDVTGDKGFSNQSLAVHGRP
jgi:CYTH domain-containing protein